MGARLEEKAGEEPAGERLRALGLELVQTHISWVLLGERDVWKVKKPVDFGFLDFSSLAARRSACEAEVALNRRLAKDVYRGVVPVTRDPHTGEVGLGGPGEVVDWAVHMRRLSEDDRADSRLVAGALSRRDIERIAERLAAFHALTPTTPEQRDFGSVSAISANVEENFAQTKAEIHDYVTEAQAEEIAVWQRSFLLEHRASFERRMERDRIRDGHGDLRLEHIYLEGEEITIIDCIEFSERYRVADVAADIAFLAMDLTRHGHPELAEHLVAHYAASSGDYGLYRVLDFYESYRAFVRAKVAMLRAADPHATESTRTEASAEARRHFLLALASERRPLLAPQLVVVAGTVASGKTTLARKIGDGLTAPVLEADRTRKQLLGVPPSQDLSTSFGGGAYDAETTQRVYAELHRRAEEVLRSDRTVIVDASFRRREDRKKFRLLARSLGLPFRLIECRVPPEEARRRLERRTREETASDARVDILDDFVHSYEPIEELSENEHLVVDTTRPIEENLESLGSRLGAWPEGLTT